MEEVRLMSDGEIKELLIGQPIDEVRFSYDWIGVFVLVDLVSGKVLNVIPDRETVVGMTQYTA